MCAMLSNSVQGRFSVMNLNAPNKKKEANISVGVKKDNKWAWICCLIIDCLDSNFPQLDDFNIFYSRPDNNKKMIPALLIMFLWRVNV